VSWGQNRLDVFVRIGSHFEHQYWDAGSGWASTWDDRGTPSPTTSFVSKPSIVSSLWYSLDIVGLGNDGNVYHLSWTASGWKPSTYWEPLTTVGVFAGTPAITSWAPNRLDVFVTDLWHAAWHLAYDYGWQPLDSHGGVFTSDLIETSWGINRLDVFGRGQDNGLWWESWPGSWTSWLSLGGP
jgi:hypothetical protein